MKKKVLSKNVVALGMTMAMTLPLLAGCGSANADSTSSPNSASDSTMNSDEIVTLTGAIFLESIESSSIKTDPVSEYIRDRFGVQFEIISDCSGNTWDEKFPAMLASGDLPDVFWVVKDPATGYSGTIKKLIDADAIVCLDDYPELFEEYNSDPILEAEMNYVRKFISPDGKAYSFPMYFGETNYAKGLLNTIALRWDAYEAAGCPEFSNYDELADALKLMQDAAQPDVNGNQPYAVSGWFGEGSGWGDWEMLYSYGQSYANSSAALQVKNEESISDINFYTDEESPYWEYLAFMNKCYRLGLIDPDAFTMTWDEYNAEMENGSFLYVSAGWLTDQKNDIISANLNDENAGFVHFKAPSDYKDFYCGGSWGYGDDCMYCISKNCKNIEKAIELLTWISSQEGSLIMENGPEGLAWDYDENGIPVGHEDYLQMGQFDSTSYELYGSNLYHHLKGYSDATPLTQYGGVTANLRLSDAASKLSIKPYEQAAMDYFGASSFLDENWLNRSNKTFTFNLLGACGAVPEEYTMSQSNIVNYFYNQQFAAIQAETEDDFKAIQQDMIQFAKDNNAIEIQQYYIGIQDNYKNDLLSIANQISDALKK